MGVDSFHERVVCLEFGLVPDGEDKKGWVESFGGFLDDRKGGALLLVHISIKALHAVVLCRKYYL